MYFVDNNSAVPVMPAVKPVVSSTPLFFTEGGNGVPPTWPGPDWFNIVQTELLNLLKEAGIDPDKANHAQLLAAMKKLFLTRSNPFADIKADGADAVAIALSNLGLGTAAEKDVGTGTGQIPDMSDFTYSTSGSAAFVIKLPGGIVIQGDNFTTDSNGYQLITMGLALSDYQVLVCEGQSGGWTASGGIYSFLTAYGANKVSRSQFSVRSASWRSSDKNFIAQSTVGTWIAIGRI